MFPRSLKVSFFSRIISSHLFPGEDAPTDKVESVRTALSTAQPAPATTEAVSFCCFQRENLSTKIVASPAPLPVVPEAEQRPVSAGVR